MTAPTSILVPTDFSTQAEHALDYACTLATKLDATIHLLTVIGVPALGVPELGAAMAASVLDSMIDDNQVALDRLADQFRDRCKVGDVLLRTGDARDVINQAVTEVGADLIILGTHGRRGLSRALLGSVAEYIVRTAKVPVLTVRTGKAG
jgi:nucleotide-binding universal stress UspA family protein